MKNNQLVFIDLLLGFILLPLCLFLKIVRRSVAKITRPKFEGILIIKFLGAGNFVAIQHAVSDRNADILTASSNRNAINAFDIGRKVYYINDSNLFNLCTSVFLIISKLIFKNYHQVINLETESKFAKFIVGLTSAEVLSGVTNTHKSYIDHGLYDRYLVNPSLLDKDQVISLLEGFKETPNPNLGYMLDLNRSLFLQKGLLNGIKKIVISPTGSSTDSIRRLDVEKWYYILDVLFKRPSVESISVVFPSTNDEQYFSFKEIVKDFSSLNILITSYSDFVHEISTADLVITIDSQALHIAQINERPTIGLFGPSFPFGVSYKPTTYPLTKSLVCSPCRHKYWNLPCGGDAPCMKFDHHHFDIFTLINSD